MICVRKVDLTEKVHYGGTLMSRRIVPLILSLIYCGLGQLYNRQVAKGLDFIIIYTILLASWFVPSLRAIGLSLVPLMWFIGMVDAYMGDGAIFNKKKWMLGVLPGLIISLLMFYVLYIQPSMNSNDLNTRMTRNATYNTEVFSVEVDSFESREQAKSLYKDLSLKAYSVRIERSEIMNKTRFYVLIGKFSKAEDTTPLVKKMLEQEGYPNSKLHISSSEN